MGWRDLIVTSHPRESVPGTLPEGGFCSFVDFGPRYEKENLPSILDSGQDSIPQKPSTEYTKPPHTSDKGAPSIAPISPGWLVAYRDSTGKLRGGCDERAYGTVHACTWTGQTWMLTVQNGDQIPLGRIVSVGKTDAAGAVLAAWTVRDCGYNGQG